MFRFILTSLLLTGVVTSCSPMTQQKVAGVTVTPMLVKASEAASLGNTLTIQGRYLGGPSTGKIILGADENGKAGYTMPTDSVKSWTDSEIVVMIPKEAPVGGSWLFIEVNGRKSTGLPISIRK